MSNSLVPYATLADVKREIKQPSSTVNSEEDEFLVAALRFVMSRIRERLYYDFVPAIETRLLSTPPYFAEPVWELDLDQPLLSVTSVTDGDGTVLVKWDKTQANRDTSDYVATPLNKTPKWAIRKLRDGNWRKKSTGFGEVEVAGIWGYHTDYANAWLDSSDTVQDNPLSDSATTITVNDADGADILQQTPRFSVGSLLLIESEYVLVTAVNTSTNTLTVIRGINGSTAASHAQNTAIKTWRSDASIIRAVTKWAAYLYNRRGSYSRTSFDSLGVTSFPADVPEEVDAILRSYPSNVQWMTVDDIDVW